MFFTGKSDEQRARADCTADDSRADDIAVVGMAMTTPREDDERQGAREEGELIDQELAGEDPQREGAEGCRPLKVLKDPRDHHRCHHNQACFVKRPPRSSITQSGPRNQGNLCEI